MFMGVGSYEGIDEQKIRKEALPSARDP